MSVTANVGYGLEVANVSRDEIDRWVAASLQMVDLSDKAQNRPAQLSNGQRQRVALARALIRHPRVLLLDEPLSALDLKLREAMQVELKHLHKKLGLTFIMVTHDQTEALVMSDRVVVMNEGRIEQDGTPTELYEHPITPFVANFIGTSSQLVAKVVSSNGDALVLEIGESRFAAHSNGTQFISGQTVQVCIRPEKVKLIDNPAGVLEGHPVMKGKVSEHFFHGNAGRLAVALSDQTAMIVDVPLGDELAGTTIPAQGHNVVLTVNPKSITVFAAR